MKTLDTPINEKTSFETQEHQIVTGILMSMEGVFSKLAGDASEALSLHDLGKDTEITKAIKRTLESPLTNISQISTSLLVTTRELVKNLITSFAKSHKSNLKFVALSHEDNVTHVFWGLNSDTTEEREVFYELLDYYEKHDIANSYPIIFHFIPENLLQDIFNIILINLDEQAPKSV
jgi:hypothetical protein